MGSPRLSIIVPVFNGSDTLQRTIDSVLAQTLQNYELIIIDGGSTDRTIDILKSFSSEKIKWKTEPDRGIYDAMNKGIAWASGDWLYFLGGDDYLFDDTVLENIFTAKLEEADLIYGNVYDATLRRIYDGEFDYDKLLINNICHQSIFYRKTLFDKFGNFSLRYPLFADWEFNLRCFSTKEIRIRFFNDTIAYYSKGGASAAYNDVGFFREILFHLRLERLFQKGSPSLKSVLTFDRWWRLLRSMRLKKSEDIKIIASTDSLPSAILIIYRFQKNIPYSILRLGIFSKTLMLCCYVLIGFSKKFGSLSKLP